ncbi:MAG: DUF2812 domain-containing protein [Thomasclavelia sp.]|uniref:DUF2812 domain-containing protein n=1 Tax=Thomasclavelia sp. TaxID=3025757 RepID=UPI0039A3B4C7
MKVRYRIINDLLMHEDNCIAYLEKMAVKGWKLEKVGLTWFKFKKQIPKQLKYQFDYLPLEDEYLKILAADGYKFVDNFRDISIFYNENIEAPDLHTDKVTKLMALKNNYKLTNIVAIFIISLIFFIMDKDPGGFYKILVRDTVGSYVLNSSLVFNRYFFDLLLFMFCLDGVIQLLCRYNLNLKIADKKSHDRLIRYLYWFENIVSLVILFIVIIYSINIAFYNPMMLISLGVCALIYIPFAYFINKIVYRENDFDRRMVKRIFAVALFLAAMFIVDRLDFNSKDDLIYSKFQVAPQITNEQSKTLLISRFSIYGSDDEDTIFYESIYTCFNEYFARETFKELICQGERESRMPTIIDGGSVEDSWLEDKKYLSYNQAIKKFIRLENKYVDECYNFNDEYYAIKDNKILISKLIDGVDINNVLQDYFN